MVLDEPGLQELYKDLAARLRQRHNWKVPPIFDCSSNRIGLVSDVADSRHLKAVTREICDRRESRNIVIPE